MILGRIERLRSVRERFAECDEPDRWWIREVIRDFYRSDLVPLVREFQKHRRNGDERKMRETQQAASRLCTPGQRFNDVAWEVFHGKGLLGAQEKR